MRLHVRVALLSLVALLVGTLLGAWIGSLIWG
jgi:hypothetical protein